MPISKNYGAVASGHQKLNVPNTLSVHQPQRLARKKMVFVLAYLKHYGFIVLEPNVISNYNVERFTEPKNDSQNLSSGRTGKRTGEDDEDAHSDTLSENNKYVGVHGVERSMPEERAAIRERLAKNGTQQPLSSSSTTVDTRYSHHGAYEDDEFLVDDGHTDLRPSDVGHGNGKAPPGGGVSGGYGTHVSGNSLRRSANHDDDDDDNFHDEFSAEDKAFQDELVVGRRHHLPYELPCDNVRREDLMDGELVVPSTYAAAAARSLFELTGIDMRQRLKVFKPLPLDETCELFETENGFRFFFAKIDRSDFVPPSGLAVGHRPSDNPHWSRGMQQGQQQVLIVPSGLSANNPKHPLDDDGEDDRSPTKTGSNGVIRGAATTATQSQRREERQTSSSGVASVASTAGPAFGDFNLLLQLQAKLHRGWIFAPDYESLVETVRQQHGGFVATILETFDFLY